MDAPTATVDDELKVFAHDRLPIATTVIDKSPTADTMRATFVDSTEHRMRSLLVQSVVIAVIFCAPVAAQPPSLTPQKTLPYDDVRDFCNQYEGVLEPDAPSDEAFVGTFDALRNDEFTWAPGVFVGAVPPPYVPPGARIGPWLEAYIRIQEIVEQFGMRDVMELGSRFPMTARMRPTRPSGPRRRLADDISVADIPMIASPKGHAPDDKAYHVRVRGARVYLRFRVINRPANVPFVVRLFIPIPLGGGVIESSAVQGVPGDESVIIEVPPIGYAWFKVSVGPNSFEDPIGFSRPPSLGCFTLEATPISYVYEPPGSGSSQAYTEASQVGTVIKTFTTESPSSTSPRHVPFFTEVAGLAKVLGAIGPIVAIKYPAAGKYLSAAGDALTGLLGKAEENSTVAHSVSQENGVLVQHKEEHTLRTTAHLGPGRGDVITFFINPVFAWFVAQDEETGKVYITVSLLSWESIGGATAEDLRLATGAISKLVSAETIRALLEVDPLTDEYRQFHPPSGSNPAPGRFVPAGDAVYHAGFESTWLVEHVVQYSDYQSEQIVKTLTRTEEAGFLGYIFSGLPQTSSRSVSTLEGSTIGTTIGDTARVTLTLSTAVGEGLYLQPYYDTLFGTFAFVPLTVGSSTIAGVVLNTAGQPLSKTVIALDAGTRRIRTQTDAQGRFRFPAAGVPRGTHNIVIDGQRHGFSFAGGRTTTVNVRQR